ncbi:MAG: hypothetical protein WD423_00155 [Rhodothermales bacterium]
MSSSRIYLTASGDLRLSANRMCWPAQAELEQAIVRAVEAEGYAVDRRPAYDEEKEHGFIDSQRLGMKVFSEIDRDRPLIVACAAWQYSHHVLAGLTTHEGPILTVANWSGQWPGLVGMLNLNGSLTKAGVPYSTLWVEDFESADFTSLDFTSLNFTAQLRRWLSDGAIDHDTSHVRPAVDLDWPPDPLTVGGRIAHELQRDKAIMGVFDEGCMGMYNAIVPDHLLHPTGIFKERLSQSALYYEAMQVADEEADRCRSWLEKRGMTFDTGMDPLTELTDEQIRLQLKTYVAALRIADDFGCATIGIQYQQGLKDLLPASDLAEGLLNNTDRPPVTSRDGTRELYAGRALPHFNEVDECAGVDALVTHRVWKALGFDPETTLHDVRWGDPYDGDYVWVFEISGSAPPRHFIDGYAGAVSERQPPMYFGLGGGTVKGVSKPGEIVWSRIFVEDDRLKADVGRATVVELPREETERRWQSTTPQWPIMHAVLHGVTRDQLMARHKSNHIQVAYAPSAEEADHALAAKVGAFQGMGIETFVCGGPAGDGA